MRTKLALATFFLVLTPLAQAQTQAMDPDYAAKVKEWTTKPEFLSPLVDHLPLSTTVPSPKEILGHHIGEPKKLTYYADVVRYYRTLAEKSPRVKVIDIGKTEEGRDSIIVFVGSEDSIKNLDTNRKNLARLADPRGLTDDQAHELITHTKPIYTLSGGLHSSELGPPEMLMELAYRLVTEDSALIKRIRDEVVVSHQHCPQPTPTAATATSTGTTATSSTSPTPTASTKPESPTGASTPSTTTTATSTTPASPIKTSSSGI